MFCLTLQAQKPVANAGGDQSICPGLSVGLGGNPAGSGAATLAYAWQPSTNLSNPNIPNPTAYPSNTTTYTLTVTNTASGEKDTDAIIITVYNATVSAGSDVTIDQGQTTTLHAQVTNGCTGVYWTPTTNINNQNTAAPDVFPVNTTTYHVEAVYTFKGGPTCYAYDDVIVKVIPGKKLFFYNTFTPNGDGANDVFYVGNIEQYPDNVLEIYNRYGQKIFTKTGYSNEWNGTYEGQEIPGGTYFYFLDTKSPAGGTYKGSVTIIK